MTAVTPFSLCLAHSLARSLSLPPSLSLSHTHSLSLPLHLSENLTGERIAQAREKKLHCIFEKIEGARFMEVDSKNLTAMCELERYSAGVCGFEDRIGTGPPLART